MVLAALVLNNTIKKKLKVMTMMNNTSFLIGHGRTEPALVLRQFKSE
jgi:hypothetical protein